MRINGKTDIGRDRLENQDNYRAGQLSRGPAWGIVCDGMGGGQHGRLASTLAAATIERCLVNGLARRPKGAAMEALLNEALCFANAEIFERASGMVMGTTAVCAVIDEGTLYLAHAGDSRAYLFEGDALVQLTRDHSMVQLLVEQGTLTPEEARLHPEKNVITRALGVEALLEPTIQQFPMPRGPILLLCSDGLSNMLSDERIAALLAGEDFYEMPQALVTAALAAGGRDNITVLLMQEET